MEATSPDERRSPPTDRVVRVLKLLAAEPSQALGLSEVARRLDLGKATCLAILNELTAARVLVRDPETRRYSLGPVLVELGFAAQEGFTALQAARARLDDLAARTGFACTASAVVDDAHVVLARAGSPASNDPTSRVGQRFAFAPPWGTVNVAWDVDEAVDAWLAKEPIVPVPVDRDQLRQVVAAARRRGYLVEVATELGLRVNAVLADAADRPAPAIDLVVQVASSLGYREYLLDPIDVRSSYDVAMVAAPTFDRAGRQELLIALFGFHPSTTGAALRSCVDEVLAATRAITAEVGGHDPWT